MRYQKEYTNDKEIEIVKLILEKSGINCIPKVLINTEQSKTDIDLFAVCENIILLIECVGKGDFGPKIKKAITDFGIVTKDFDKICTHISVNYKEFYRNNKRFLKSQNRVFKRLVVSFNKETADSIEDSHIRLLKQNEVFLWTKEDMYYYSKISDCTYDHCKYEILNFLNIKPEEIISNERELSVLTYPAYGKKIRKDLYILNFILPVNILLQRSSVKRFHDISTKEGYQRLLDKTKLKRMRGYLLKEIPIYPNNLICVLNNKAVVKDNQISRLELNADEKAKEDVFKKEITDKIFLVELPDTYNIFEIIDGQHRLFSFAQTKYHQFEKTKSTKEKNKIRKEDIKIKDLSEKSNLIVTAIYSKKSKWGEPGKLFFEINTTQTRIKPEDIIDLTEKYYKDSPVSDANKLLRKLNTYGILKDKIKIKFWQEERIKRTSLISYSGLKDIFDKGNKSYNIFTIAYNKQTKIKNYLGFCFVLINNYLWSLAELVRKKYPRKYSEIEKDLTLKKYYFFSAVFSGAVIRLLRHFICEKDKAFNILNELDKAIQKENTKEKTINSNIPNHKLQNLFKKGLKCITSKYKFTKDEFKKQKDWGPNKWAKIESDLFYLIRKKYPNFGDENLIAKKHRR